MCRYCQQIFEHQDLYSHINSCKFKLIQCNKCKQMVFQQKLKEHIEFLCSELQTQCQICQKKIKNFEIQSHQIQCKKNFEESKLNSEEILKLQLENCQYEISILKERLDQFEPKNLAMISVYNKNDIIIPEIADTPDCVLTRLYQKQFLSSKKNPIEITCLCKLGPILIAIGTKNSKILVWNLEEEIFQAQTDELAHKGITCMETFGKGEVKIEEIIDNSEKGKLLLSDFGLHLLTGFENGTLCVWDIDLGKNSQQSKFLLLKQFEIKNHAQPVTSILDLQNDNIVIFACNCKTKNKLPSIIQFKKQLTLVYPPSPPLQNTIIDLQLVHKNRKGELFVSVQDDNSIILWQIFMNKNIYLLKLEQMMCCVALKKFSIETQIGISRVLQSNNLEMSLLICQQSNRIKNIFIYDIENQKISTFSNNVWLPRIQDIAIIYCKNKKPLFLALHENGLSIFDEKFNLVASFFDENFIQENSEKCFIRIMDVNQLNKCIVIKLAICQLSILWLVDVIIKQL